MPKEKHTVQILIDARELELIAIFHRAYPEGNPELDFSKNLHCGDVHILVDGQLALIIERKRADDFRSSVFSNEQRFRKQRARMILERRNNPDLVVMFVFEGSVFSLYYSDQTGKSNNNPKFLHKLQEELVHKYGIPIKYVNSTTETAKYIGQIRDTYVDYGSPHHILEQIQEEGVEAIGTHKHTAAPNGGKPLLNLSPQQFLQRALTSTVYGMTVEKAEVIGKHYHSLRNLLHCYDRLTSEKKKQLMLANLRISEDKKRFGPKLSTRIYEAISGIASTEPIEPVVVESIQPAVEERRKTVDEAIAERDAHPERLLSDFAEAAAMVFADTARINKRHILED